MNVPVPDVVHCPVVVLPDTLPFNCAVITPPQIGIFTPAFTIGDGMKVITKLSFAAGHCPFGFVVKVSVTDPALILCSV